MVFSAKVCLVLLGQFGFFLVLFFLLLLLLSITNTNNRGFNDYEDLNGNLDDIECYASDIFYGNCNKEIARKITEGSENGIDSAIVVAYFIDEIYDHDDLFSFKTSYGEEEYNYVEILGMPLEQSSQFYHRLNKLIKQRRYRQYPNDFDDFKVMYCILFVLLVCLLSNMISFCNCKGFLF